MSTLFQNSTVDGMHLLIAPSEEQIAHLWDLRRSIPEEVRYAFADVSPTLNEFLDAMADGGILCLLTEDDTGEIVTSIWLHDLECDHEDIVRIGWLGGYVNPRHRGRRGLAASHMILDYFDDLGVSHIHAAVHVKNRRAQSFTCSKSMLGFTRVCEFPHWTTFNDEPADFIIYTRHQRDKMLAWMCARRLAEQRSLVLLPG